MPELFLSLICSEKKKTDQVVYVSNARAIDVRKNREDEESNEESARTTCYWHEIVMRSACTVSERM